MFALFFSLYLAMFTGQWINFTSFSGSFMKDGFNAIGQFITSIFGDTSYTELGNELFKTITFGNYSFPTYYAVIAVILATITSIGIVVMAVKGVKKAFGIFFGHIR